MNLAEKVREVPDWPQKGVGFKDVTPLLADPEALRYTIEQLAEWGAERKPDLVLGAEARGFILGAAIAKEIGCGFVPISSHNGVKVKLTPAEIEFLAEMEHDRFVIECRCEGWVYGQTRDVNNKISTYLVGWNELSDDVKEWDRNAVRRISDLLTRAGFEIYRLK